MEHAFLPARARVVGTRPSSPKGHAAAAAVPWRLWSLKTVAKRLMGEEEQRVVPVNERSTERRKRTSETNLLATMGQEAPADLLRKLRGQKLSQKALDEKLLEVIIKLDACGASGEDAVDGSRTSRAWDLDHERRSVLAERAPPSRETWPRRPQRPWIGASASSSRGRSSLRTGAFRGPRRARVKHLMTAARVSPLSRPPAPAPETIVDPSGPGAVPRRANDARRRSRASRSDLGSSMGSRPSTAEREPELRRSVGEEEDEVHASLWDAAALGRIDLVDQALKNLTVDAPDYDTDDALHYAAAEATRTSANIC